MKLWFRNLPLKFYAECYAAYLWTAGSSRNFDMCKKPYLKLNS